MRANFLAVVAVIASLVLGTGVVSADGPAPPRGQHVPNEVLIQFKPGTPEAAKADARSRARATMKENIRTLPTAGRGDLELDQIPPGLAVADAVRGLQGHPAVLFAEPNWMYTRQETSNDSAYLQGLLWGVYGATTTPANAYGSGAASAWRDGNVGSADVYVGVIDEGIQFDHPDLAGQVWTNPLDLADGVDNDGNGYVDDVHGWDFDGNNNSVYDGSVDDHGTHVAGTIGAKGGNEVGVAGVTWRVTIVPAKFLGRRGGTTANAIKAVDYLTRLKTDRGLNVVASNNSWSGGGYSQALYDAIGRANDANILFVAAAGNGGTNNDTTPSYPASYDLPNVIAVAAIDRNGALASFSQYGVKSVHIGAPGVDTYSTLPGGQYGYKSGTSMATPHVTGAVALHAAAKPMATAADLKSAILGGAVYTPSLAGKVATSGRLSLGAPDTTAPIISNVAVAAIGATSATITWTTDDPASSRVEFGTTSLVLDREANGAAGVVSHSVALSGLAPNTTYSFRVSSASSGGTTTSAVFADAFKTTAAGNERMNAGGPVVGVWSPDRPYADGGTGYVGGSTYGTTASIEGATADTTALYQTERFGKTFSYRVSVPNGRYTVTLKFAEIAWSRKGQRVFNVAMEQRAVLTNFDIYAQAGRNAALDKQFLDVEVTDGVLDIDFTTVKDNAKISAIEVVAQ